MITYDWQKRLKKDCKDFINHKIPNKDYDFEIIYNAYPERIQGEIPPTIITFVAKELGKIISKNPDDYLDFLEYIYKYKEDAGKKIFSYIMKKISLRFPGEYDNIVINFIKNSDDKNVEKQLFDNNLLPLLKKYPDKYLQSILSLINEETSEIIIKNTFRILANFIKTKPSMTENILEDCQSFWRFSSTAIHQGIARLLKRVYKINPDIYWKIYRKFEATYNPNYIDILANAISEDNKLIRDIVNKWNNSGNVRIKKAAAIAEKNLKKLNR